jgi:hypothetical protein
VKQAKVTFQTTLGPKIVTITAGNDTIYSLLSHIKKPLCVTQCTANNERTAQMMTLFGQSWSWEERPEELKAQYDAELNDYALALPNEINGRTNPAMLPDTRWLHKYIPTESEIEAIRESRKTPEQREREAREEQERIVAAKKREEERIAQDAARKAEENELRAKYPFLQQANGAICGVNLASANLRTLLGRLWPSVRFSVRLEKYSGGNSTNITWTDGPSEKQVEAYANRFQSGSFDGMTDCYNYSADAWHIFGETKYLSCRREYSDEKVGALIPAIADAMEAAKTAESESTLHPIGETGYFLNTDKYEYKLWSDRFLSSCRDAEGVARRMLEHETMPESDSSAAPAVPVETEATSGTAIVRYNAEHNGIEVKFTDRPADSIITWLKSHRFRWSMRQKIWYARFNEALFGEVKQTLSAA